MTLANDTDLADVFVAIADSLREGYDIADTMSTLTDASTTFTAAVEAGVLLHDGNGSMYVAASSSERTHDLEQAQIGTHEGPCLETIRSGEYGEAPDPSVMRQRWPEFVPLALERGFRSVHAIPLTLRAQTIGGLNLFSDRAESLSDRDQSVARALAQLATITVIQHRALTEHSTLNGQLQNALDSRILIEQAKGIISAQLTVPVEGAFVHLRRYARNNNRGLTEVACQVVREQLQIR